MRTHDADERQHLSGKTECRTCALKSLVHIDPCRHVYLRGMLFVLVSVNQLRNVYRRVEAVFSIRF